MKLVETAIKRPVTVAVAVIFIILFGFISLYSIPVQLTPDVENPKITVDTVWTGASPFEVESEIVNEQEEELKSVEGLVEMTSESSEDRGTVVLEFEVGTDVDSKVVKVSNKLDQVKDYPDDADNPVISSVDVRSSAIAWFILKPLPGNSEDIYNYHDFADEFIKPRLERVSGVGSSNIFGGQEREIQVVFNPNELAIRGLTIRELADAINSENENYSGGSFDEGKRRYVVRTIGEYISTDDIENVVIKNENGSPVYIRDVAEVKLGYKDPDYAVRQNGDPAIAINALKESGANTIDVIDGLHQEVERLNSGLLKDNGLYLYNVYEESGYITNAIDLVKQNLIIGGLLAIAVLFIFLRSGSSTLIVATAIPISIIGAFVVMALLGRTINVISLAGMSFAVGMVIDNSIVVLENIYRHMQMGKTRIRAAYDGTVEVWGAVLASTLTTAAVFLPIIFIKEQAGQLFRDIAIAISVSVILSLLVSITVIPTAASMILNIAENIGKSSSKILTSLYKFGRDVSIFISSTVNRIIHNKGLRLAVILVFTLGSILFSYLLIPKTEYLPTGNRNLIFGILIPPPGYNIDEFISIGEQIESDLSPYFTENSDTQIGKDKYPKIKNFFYVARGRQVFMGAVAEDQKKIRELLPLMQGSLTKIPGMFAVVTQSSLFRSALGEGRSIKIQITGSELEGLIDVARKIFFTTMEVIPDAQLRPIPSLDLGNPELQLATDRERASDVGVTNQDLGFSVRALVNGAKVSDYIIDGQEIDLVVKGEEEFSNRTQSIEDIMIQTSNGSLVTVGSIADIVLTNGPERIDHFERERTIAIQVNPPETMPLETAIEKIQNEVLTPLKGSGQIPANFNLLLTGTADKLTETREALQWNFLLAILISFLLMASLFESFIYPLVIMFSVPLASFGGFVGLRFLNLFIYQPLDILTMLGFVILIGIVINNAILIVHQSLNFMRNEGLPPDQAILESVKSRIRPIFMSTMTSVFGMLPLVVLPGAGSELYRGLGSVIVGGLVFSTIFTLFLVPSVFSLVLNLRNKNSS
ncbi:MAG: efflux RND transporter permease subunit [Thermodesulfobacteriota bacterium]